MKRVLSFALAMLCAGALFAFPAAAESSSDLPEGAVPLGDGYYYTLETFADPANLSPAAGTGFGLMAAAATTNYSGGVTCKIANASNVIIFHYTVNGTWRVSGSTVTCISAGSAYSIKHSDWSNKSSHAYLDGMYAAADGVFIEKLFGIFITDTINITITAGCTTSGVIY